MDDPFVGKLTYFRVYSGKLSAGSRVLNATNGRTERVGRLLMMHANHREEIEECYAGDIVAGGVDAETRQVLANLSRVLDAAGLDFASVVKCNVFLVDMADFAAMNTVYAEVIPGPFPARSTVAVAALPLGARVEIECVAVR